jgi:hypothetical protein
MSPHIVFLEEQRRYSFQVHAEQKPFLIDLNFNEALTSFLHLAFVGNLRYPENGEAVAVWIQRKVAGINDPGNFYSFFLFEVPYRYLP